MMMPTASWGMWFVRQSPGIQEQGEPVENALRSREHILEQLEGFPADLERVVFADHVTAEDIYRPGSDGGWGIAEILPHLRDWEEIYFERARRIVNEDDPHIPGYDDSLWPIERNYSGQDPAEVFEEFRALRGEHLEFLIGLAPEQWQRTGEHSMLGTITLHFMENTVCDRDLERLAQAREVLAG
ncbi:MAG: DinB family protein [Thermomicrobiales bacterium]